MLKTLARLVAIAALTFVPLTSFTVPLRAQAPAPATFKLAFFNIQSGKGAPALPGFPALFPDTANCADASLPRNAWGLGIVQRELVARLGDDPAVVALGLAEAWNCGNVTAVRNALGWRAASSERNGVAIVARYGFAGPEQWTQLDTSRNLSPNDTMWLLRVPVCLDEACGSSMPMFTAHWSGSGATNNDSNRTAETQAQQTIDAMKAAAPAEPHALLGDLNVFEGTAVICGQNPKNTPVQMLRAAGYVDAWRAIYGLAEGNTGMWNRPLCGMPLGNTFKRIDYAWSKGMSALSMTRFGMVNPGEAAPSDHAGIIAEYPMPAVLAASVPPTASITAPSGDTVTGPVTIAVDAQDDEAVTRVEVLVDDVPLAVASSAPFNFPWDTIAVPNGAHTLRAAVSDAAGNRRVSAPAVVTVANPVAPGDEIVLLAADGTPAGTWLVVADGTAASGRRIQNPDAGAAEATYAPTRPSSYVDLTLFDVVAGKPYRLWVRGKAEGNSAVNDAVYVQFSGSIDATGTPVNRIGTTSGVSINLEECEGCGLAGWGWQDNGWPQDVLGPLVYFAASGPQTMRIIAREDGLGLDQVVLSSRQFLTRSPGAAKDDATFLIAPPDAAPAGPPPPPPPPPPPADTVPPGSTGTSSPDEIVLYAAAAPVIAGNWVVTPDTTAAGGARLHNPNAGLAKPAAALAMPVSYFELTFSAEARKPYRLWLRAKAQNDDYNNDSVFVQFDGSTDAAGNPIQRIGTTASTTVILEDCSGCGVSGWGWQDNGYGAGVVGPVIYFAASGPQRVRIQVREDGIGIDQVVLSAVNFLTLSPGLPKRDGTILAIPGSSPVANAPPQVSLTGPAPGSTFTPGVGMTITADATDDAGIARVDFYAGATLIGSSAARPFTTTWLNVPPAAYVLTAKALDTGGLTTTSAGVNVVVALPLNAPPVVSLTQPVTSTVIAPAAIALAADATDTDGGIARVDFYARPAGAAGSAPAAYDAVTDLEPRRKPTLPSPGKAGSAFVDPTFGTAMRRITDGATRPGLAGRSYRTPSGTHQNAWSASGRYFYTVSTDGTVIPFAFDPASGAATRINPGTTGDGGLVLPFYIEPHFSYVQAAVIYGSDSTTGARRTIDQYDFASGAFTRLLDLDDVVPDLAGTFIGGIGSSAGAVERIVTFFGGTSQDRHHYLLLFDRANPGNRRLLDTLASTLDGVPTALPLNFKLHAAVVDRSGRYVTLYPTVVDLQAPRNAAENYLWDTATDTFTELRAGTALVAGHDAYGYGMRVNQDCCTSVPYDAAQWQLRTLDNPLATRDAIVWGRARHNVNLADHESWHNARPDRAMPYISGLYRYDAAAAEWGTWDDEIIGVETGMAAGVGATVWRFAHHRSDVRSDTDPLQIAFWYTPRPNVSPDGRWVLFTSNWEKTLGTDPGGQAGAGARQDVFLLSLADAASASPIEGTTRVGSSSTSPYAATWNNAGPGTYTVTARAVDTGGAVTTSAPVTVTVRAPTADDPPVNAPPVVAITSPTAGTTVTAPGTMAIIADAADPDGTIARVEFYANATLVGTSTGSPYSVTWSGVAAGTYVLTARATDSGGTTVTGSAVTVLVAPAPAPPVAPVTEIVMYAASAPVVAGNWIVTPDTTAAGGARLQNPNAGLAKVAAALAAPASYFELTFTADAKTPYRLWLRARAQSDSYNNDSVYVQFDGSTDAAGKAVNRIGTTSGATVILEDCSGCNVKGWGWQDNGNGAGVLGPVIYFATSGPQRLRIQVREDGIGIDQVVLSAVAFLTVSPGVTKNDTRILPLAPAGTGPIVVEPPPPPPPPPVVVPPPAPPGVVDEVVLYAAAAPVRVGNWVVTPDASAAGGARLQNPNAGLAKPALPLAAPLNYVELTFMADAGKAYRFWLRARAQSDSYNNDSVYVQFDGSVDAAGNATTRIGTTSGATVILEDCSGCNVKGWGWQDNGYGAGTLGPVVRFATTGLQRVRIQVREDGIGIDQVVFSAVRYITQPPGGLKNDATILAATPTP